MERRMALHRSEALRLGASLASRFTSPPSPRPPSPSSSSSSSPSSSSSSEVSAGEDVCCSFRRLSRSLARASDANVGADIREVGPPLPTALPPPLPRTPGDSPFARAAAPPRSSARLGTLVTLVTMSSTAFRPSSTVASEDVMRLKSRIFAFSSFRRDAIERVSRSSLLDPTDAAETRAKGGGCFRSEVLVARFGSLGDGENAAPAEIEAARIRDIFGTGGFVLDRLVRATATAAAADVLGTDGRPTLSGGGRVDGTFGWSVARLCIVVAFPSSSSSSMPSRAALSSSVSARRVAHAARSRPCASTICASAAALVSLDFSSCARICAGARVATSCKPAADASLRSAARHDSSSLSRLSTSSRADSVARLAPSQSASLRARSRSSLRARIRSFVFSSLSASSNSS
mmetsp:Transcript_11234/g.46886  ORF Transcript_11234/g.46886 Transcript_11234/m.46886 type:complete len:404 (-) Transcript_11234:456-1667(-)